MNRLPFSDPTVAVKTEQYEDQDPQMQSFS